MGGFAVEFSNIEIPPEWEHLETDGLEGVIFVIGASDVGKSTFARYLYQKLRGNGINVAYLDGDPGQGILGPPGTLTLASGDLRRAQLPEGADRRRWFVGSTSPKGHMLPVVVGAQRLAQAAFQSGVKCLVYDTTGLVAADQGGAALKLAKIDLLRPPLVVAIQRDRELEALLRPLRRFKRLSLVELQPAAAVVGRSREARQRSRASRYEEYFSPAQEMSIYWPQLAVVPAPNFTPNRLLGFEGKHGYLQGLGILLENDRHTRQITVLSPLSSLHKIEVLRIGDLAVDRSTYRDEFV